MIIKILIRFENDLLIILLLMVNNLKLTRNTKAETIASNNFTYRRNKRPCQWAQVVQEWKLSYRCRPVGRILIRSRILVGSIGRLCLGWAWRWILAGRIQCTLPKRGRGISLQKIIILNSGTRKNEIDVERIIFGFLRTSMMAFKIRLVTRANEIVIAF